MSGFRRQVLEAVYALGTASVEEVTARGVERQWRKDDVHRAMLQLEGDSYLTRFQRGDETRWTAL